MLELIPNFRLIKSISLSLFISFIFLRPFSPAFAQLENKQTKIVVTDTDTIHRNVTKPADFKGGLGAMSKYISKNIKYPAQALNDRVEGRVVAQIVVNMNGSVGNVTILRSLSPECDAEVVRLLEEMPNWKPGVSNGENVNSYYTIPISFKLPSENRNKK